MNVTRYNYKKCLPLITHCMRTCDFLAFDFEFTGILAHPDLLNSSTDSMATRYYKLKENSRRFLPNQIGISTFKYHEQERTLEVFPFNFYIMPHAIEGVHDKIFHCQASALSFLSKYKFNFNKLFYESVGYVSHQDYLKIKTNRDEKVISQQLDKTHYQASPEAVIYANSHYEHIKTWLDRTKNLSIDDPKNAFKIDLAFTKLILYQYLIKSLSTMFPHDLLETEISRDEISMEVHLVIKRTTKEKIQEKLKLIEREKEGITLSKYVDAKKLGDYKSNKQIIEDLKRMAGDQVPQVMSEIEKLFSDLDTVYETIEKNEESEIISLLAKKIQEETGTVDLLGFTRIVDLMAKLKKPIITHNGMLDLMHLCDKFLFDIPDSYKEFKALFSSRFSNVYDTKQMLTNSYRLMNKFTNTSLSDSYQRVMQDDFAFNQHVKINENFKDYSLSGKVFHEAGFDALMTGVIFFKACTYLDVMEMDKAFSLKVFDNKHMVSTLYKNKIPMASIRTPFDFSKVDQDFNSKREFVFVLHNIPKIMSAEQLQSKIESFLNEKIKLYRQFKKDKVFFTIICEKKTEEINGRLDKEGELEVEVVDIDGSMIKMRMKKYSDFEKHLIEAVDKDLSYELPAYVNLL